jgi:hypothetical protein
VTVARLALCEQATATSAASIVHDFMAFLLDSRSRRSYSARQTLCK